MKQASFSAAAALAATFSLAIAADIPTCGEGKACPEDSPCCSQYGQCGVGAYCLGGCNPKYSFTLRSCEAAPVCKSADYKMNSLDDIARNTVYLGNPGDYNWVSSGTPVVYNDQSVLLTMAPSTVGTLLMSTHYVWYGKICAKMQSSQGQGVVTAFIMMSDVQDEIDYEWVGDNVTSVQSNYYWQGILDYNNMESLDVSNSRTNSHQYCIDWKPDTLTWSIDGQDLRTVKKSDTYNSSAMSYAYPQTPSRVQLSLWPAGLPSNGNGTITWAGGLVDWDDSNYMQNGYYYAIIDEVTVECYDTPNAEGWSNSDSGSKAYYYTSKVGTNDTIAIGNNDTSLASFLATGDKPDYDPNASASASGSSASSSATSTPESVPGISGGGAMGISGGDSGSSGGGSSSGSTDSGNGADSSTGTYTTFQQGLEDSGTSGAGRSSGSTGLAGSAVALLGFFIGALML